MSPSPDEPVIGRSGIASVAFASVVAAAAGYVVLVVVARHISPEANADFLVFWSLFFGGYGVLGGLQQEATRAVGAAALAPGSGVTRQGARVLPWSLLIGGGTAVLAAAVAPWWFPTLLAGQPVRVAVVLCVSIVALAGHVTLVGMLAGLRRWTTSALLTGGESALRLILVVVATAVGADLVGTETAVAASAVFWLGLLLVSRPARGAVGVRSEDRPARFTARALQAMVAAVGSAALVVGYPTLLRLSASGSEWASAAPLVLAISLTRAPLLMPLNAYQGVAINYFLDPRRKRGAALGRIVLAITAVGIVGATAAGVVGPWLMAAFFGAGYHVSGGLLAVLTLAAVALAVLTMTGACVLAVGQHRAYALGWILATAASAAVLFVGLPLNARAVLSLATGPVVGAIVHVVALRSAPGALRAETQPAG